MDEPFGALDERTRPAMQNLLLRLWQQNRMTVLFVTHDLEEALYVGTRLIALSQHWVDHGGASGGGARIVVDRQLPPGDPADPDFKYTHEFTAMLQSIRDGALNPSRRLAPSEFDLTHPDAVIRAPAGTAGTAAGGHHQ
jgi:NitT/TauT family transport system ATP-binding protein